MLFSKLKNKNQEFKLANKHISKLNKELYPIIITNYSNYGYRTFKQI